MSIAFGLNILQIGWVIFVLFADFLNLALAQSGISNYKLAKRLGISQTTVANWLSGETEPRPKMRADVLKLFGVREQDLESGSIHISYDDGETEKPATQTGGGQYEPWEVEATNLLRALPPDLRDRELAYLRELVSKQGTLRELPPGEPAAKG